MYWRRSVRDLLRETVCHLWTSVFARTSRARRRCRRAGRSSGSWSLSSASAAAGAEVKAEADEGQGATDEEPTEGPPPASADPAPVDDAAAHRREASSDSASKKRPAPPAGDGSRTLRPRRPAAHGIRGQHPATTLNTVPTSPFTGAIASSSAPTAASARVAADMPGERVPSLGTAHAQEPSRHDDGPSADGEPDEESAEQAVAERVPEPDRDRAGTKRARRHRSSAVKHGLSVLAVSWPLAVVMPVTLPAVHGGGPLPLDPVYSIHALKMIQQAMRGWRVPRPGRPLPGAERHSSRCQPAVGRCHQSVRGRKPRLPAVVRFLLRVLTSGPSA